MSLTTVEHPTDLLDSVLEHATRLARDVEDEGPDCGALLVLDYSPRRRWHVYGIVLTRRLSRWPERWLEITGASIKGNRVKHIDGSVGPRDTTNPTLLSNLERVARYACKRLPVGGMCVKARLVRSGAFERVFKFPLPVSSLSTLEPLPTAFEPLPERAARATTRCEHGPCGRTWEHGRSDKRFCDGTCRQRARRERLAIQVGAAPEKENRR